MKFNNPSARKNPAAYNDTRVLAPRKTLAEALEVARSRELSEPEARAAKRYPGRHAVCPDQRADQGTVGYISKEVTR